MGEIPAAAKYIAHLRGAGRASWSGFAIRLESGEDLVVYNDAHSQNRIRTTLMEEFFHLRLQHPRTVIRVLSDASGRSYDGGVEQEAYGSGAAALVPYATLKARVTGGDGTGALAEHFGVSTDLILYRLKVPRLYRARAPIIASI